jgi:hypothetical protein
MSATPTLALASTTQPPLNKPKSPTGLASPGVKQTSRPWYTHWAKHKVPESKQIYAFKSTTLGDTVGWEPPRNTVMVSGISLWVAASLIAHQWLQPNVRYWHKTQDAITNKDNPNSDYPHLLPIPNQIIAQVINPKDHTSNKLYSYPEPFLPPYAKLPEQSANNRAAGRIKRYLEDPNNTRYNWLQYSHSTGNGNSISRVTTDSLVDLGLLKAKNTDANIVETVKNGKIEETVFDGAGHLTYTLTDNTASPTLEVTTTYTTMVPLAPNLNATKHPIEEEPYNLLMTGVTLKPKQPQAQANGVAPKTIEIHLINLLQHSPHVQEYNGTTSPNLPYIEKNTINSNTIHLYLGFDPNNTQDLGAVKYQQPSALSPHQGTPPKTLESIIKEAKSSLDSQFESLLEQNPELKALLATQEDKTAVKTVLHGLHLEALPHWYSRHIGSIKTALAPDLKREWLLLLKHEAPVVATLGAVIAGGLGLAYTLIEVMRNKRLEQLFKQPAVHGASISPALTYSQAQQLEILG